MRKKLLSLMMAAALAMSMMACGGSAGNEKDTAASQETDAATEAKDDAAEAGKVYKVGICQLVQHEALDAATKGFKDALTELCGEGNVTFDEQNAQGEHNMCATIVNQFVSSDVDLILANATDPLTTAATATADIPILGTSVTDYATALQMSDWTGATGINVSGTCDLAPIEEQEDMLVELLPDAKNVGILYCSAEPNSKYQAEMFEKELDADGIAYKEYTAADSNEIQSVVTSAVSEVDAIYIPTDNTMASNTEIVKNVCVPAGIPVIAGEQGICSGCGIATLSISYYDLGRRTGEMAYEVLAKGADISTMKVETAAEVTKMYNKAICDELKISIPEGYEAIAAE